MKFFSLISAIALLFIAWVNPVNTLGEDPASVLKKAEANFEKLNDFAADFSFTLSNPSDPSAKLTKKGTLAYSQGKYVVKLSDQEFYCDGEKIWVYLPEDEEVTIYPNDPEEGFNIETLLQLYKSNAKARHDGRTTVNGKACHNIYLANSDPEMEFNQARVWLDVKSYLPVKVETVTRTQTRTVYSFSNVKTNQGLGIDKFRFDVGQYPDVEVYDETE